MDRTSMADVSGAHIVRESLHSRFGLLFLMLVVLILVPAALPRIPALSLIFTALTTAVMLSGLYAVATTRKQFLIGVFLLVPALAADWFSAAFPTFLLQLLGISFTGLFLVYLAWMVFLYVLAARRVDANIIFAALSVYLLLGFIFGTGYYMIELVAASPSAMSTLTGNVGIGYPRSEAVYYSFVTLTTLGYGDIAPIAAATRALAIVEALTGQVFLVTLMARLVSLQVAQEKAGHDNR